MQVFLTNKFTIEFHQFTRHRIGSKNSAKVIWSLYFTLYKNLKYSIPRIWNFVTFIISIVFWFFSNKTTRLWAKMSDLERLTTSKIFSQSWASHCNTSYLLHWRCWSPLTFSSWEYLSNNLLALRIKGRNYCQVRTLLKMSYHNYRERNRAVGVVFKLWIRCRKVRITSGKAA